MRARSAAVGAVIAAFATVLVGAGPAAAVDDPNIAVGKPVDATVQVAGVAIPASTCTLGSGPDNAVDNAWSNIYTDKWCVPGGHPQLHIHLSDGNGFDVSTIRIYHASAAGESPSYNTKAYHLEVTQLDQVDVAPTQYCT